MLRGWCIGKWGKEPLHMESWWGCFFKESTLDYHILSPHKTKCITKININVRFGRESTPLFLSQMVNRNCHHLDITKRKTFRILYRNKHGNGIFQDLETHFLKNYSIV